MNKKLGWTLFLSVCFIVLSISFWFGGQQRWRIEGINSVFSSDPQAEENYKERLKLEPESPILKYNLASLYFRQKKYAEAISLLREVIASNQSGEKLTRKAIFNLGNSYFRLAESEKNDEDAVRNLSDGIRLYRELINREKLGLKYQRVDKDADEDALFNFTVARNRLKLLLDKIKNENLAKERKKSLYELVKEIVESEKKILASLESMEYFPDDAKQLEARNNILKKRSENLEKLKLVKEKLNPQQPSAPNSTPRTPLKV